MAGSASASAVITGWLLVSHSPEDAAAEAVAVRRTASAARPEVSLRVSHSGSTALLVDNSVVLHAEAGTTDVVALLYVQWLPMPPSKSDVAALPYLLLLLRLPAAVSVTATLLPPSNSDVAALPYLLRLRLPTAAAERAPLPPLTTLLRDCTFLGAQRCLAISPGAGEESRHGPPAGIISQSADTVERISLLPPLTTLLSD